MQTPLILVGHRGGINRHLELEQQNNLMPRQDYIEIVKRLGAEPLGNDWSNATWYRWTRRIEERLKVDLLESFLAARQSSRDSAVLSMSERVAIPLAAMLYVRNIQIPHIVIVHKLSSGLKTYLFRVWQLHKRFTHVICVCRAQAVYVASKTELPASRVDFVYDKVDHHFFHPLEEEMEDYILAVGNEQRDYGTLIQAIAGTGLKLVIVASSPWSTQRIQIDGADSVTELKHLSYHELRQMYARARLVVVPLVDVDYAAGVNTVLEAMAMAKPLIVSQTRGITDYVVHNETGMYVKPGDVRDLRDSILSLWEEPRELNRLGANARQVVEERMNLDIYVDRIVQIVHRAMIVQAGCYGGGNSVQRCEFSPSGRDRSEAEADDRNRCTSN